MKKSSLLIVWLGFLLLGFVLPKTASSQTTPELKWWDPAENPFPVIEGQAWPEEVQNPYDRFPARAEKTVRPPVWGLSRDAAGLFIRFRSNSGEIHIRYQVEDPVDMPHMPATGVSGVDLYALSKDGDWEWSAGKYSFKDTIEYNFLSLKQDYVREYRLYLPLYNKVKWMEIGVPEDAIMEPLPVRSDKPIVVYGTSIAQGACASRPGMAWTAILGRKLDRPVINLAFSGNGRLERPVVDLIGELNPELFVIDCLPNMSGFPSDTIRSRLIETVKSLRAERAGVPLLITENACESIGSLDSARGVIYQRVNEAGRAAFSELKEAGMRDIYLLPASRIGLNIESTVDGVHPNDVGMEIYAKGYEAIIREILDEPAGPYVTTQPRIQYRDRSYDWDARHRTILEMNRQNPPGVVLIGNSITHFWGGEPEHPRSTGKDTWETYFAPLNARNLGYGWDRVENVLWRVYHDELDGYSARQVILMIGTNNIGINTDEEIVAGLQTLIQAIRSRQPSARILLLGIYPRRATEERIAGLNLQLLELSGKENIFYADPGVVLLDSSGKIKESLFTDGVHPNGEGYRLLGKALEPHLVEGEK